MRRTMVVSTMGAGLLVFPGRLSMSLCGIRWAKRRSGPARPSRSRRGCGRSGPGPRTRVDGPRLLPQNQQLISHSRLGQHLGAGAWAGDTESLVWQTLVVVGRPKLNPDQNHLASSPSLIDWLPNSGRYKRGQRYRGNHRGSQQNTRHGRTRRADHRQEHSIRSPIASQRGCWDDRISNKTAVDSKVRISCLF